MWEWAVRALGVFWAIGGIATLVVLRRERIVDMVSAALFGGLGWAARGRALLLTLGAVLTAASGLLLIGLDRAAPALLLANAAVQAVWIGFAARFLPPEDEDDVRAAARRRNAFAVWLAGTAAVIAAERFGAVRLEAWAAVEAAVAVAAVAVLAWQAYEARSLWAGGAVPTAGGEAEDAAEEDGEGAAFAVFDPSVPHRLMLAPNLYTEPLRDPDTDWTFHPEALDLAADLVARIDDLEADVRAALRPSRKEADVFVLSPVERAAFEVRIVALVEELRPHALDGDVTWWLPPVEEAG